MWVDLPQGPGAADIALARVRQLLGQGVDGHEILVLSPQRDRRARCDAVDGAGADDGARIRPEIHTYYSFAARMVRLFWPEIAAPAGFGRPLDPPVLLTYETAQYAMGQVVAARLREGYFEGLALRPQRLLSQLLDNLNKAAVNGYDVTDVGPRLRAAWQGEGERLLAFDQAQTCIDQFRAHCLAHNLVDVSLALDTFRRYLAPSAAFRAHLAGRARHLVVEGVEETVPVAQDFIGALLETADSAFLVHRRDGGYRVFLGVDPDGAEALRAACATVAIVPDPPATPASRLGCALSARFERGRPDAEAGMPVSGRLLSARHRGDMVQAVADEVVRLVAAGEATPGQIAVIAPHADGVLRFLIGRALDRVQIPCAVVRRFESLREEPEVRVGLALAALAHRDWGRRPHPADVAEALGAALSVDPVRAHLLTRAGYDVATIALRPLGADDRTLAERATPEALVRYESLRRWLESRRVGEGLPIDLFLRRLFGEVLSRPDLPASSAASYARLIASAAWFRHSAPSMGISPDHTRTAAGYAEMVEEGVVAAAHAVPMAAADPASVLVVAPVHTYLLEERTAPFQFWLDIGSMRWWEPPHQPLTNPHVLARRWPSGARWADAVDYDTRNRVLGRLVRGLCSRAPAPARIYLCWSETEGAGQPADSPLLRAALEVLRPEPDP